MPRLAGHELSDRRSLVLHQEVARRLRDNPALLNTARLRVEDWALSGSLHPRYVEAWRRLFDHGALEVSRALEDPGEAGQALRQVSPFAFVLEPRERWQLLRRAGARSDP